MYYCLDFAVLRCYHLVPFLVKEECPATASPEFEIIITLKAKRAYCNRPLRTGRKIK
jgi:hypothetical protein